MPTTKNNLQFETPPAQLNEISTVRPPFEEFRHGHEILQVGVDITSGDPDHPSVFPIDPFRKNEGVSEIELGSTNRKFYDEIDGKLFFFTSL